jgi:hypothetical protein
VTDIFEGQLSRWVAHDDDSDGSVGCVGCVPSGAYSVHRPQHWAYEGTGVELGGQFGAKHTVVGCVRKCTVHIMCLYGDTVHLCVWNHCAYAAGRGVRRHSPSLPAAYLPRRRGADMGVPEGS